MVEADHDLRDLAGLCDDSAGKTLGLVDTFRYYAVSVVVGATRTKGGPRSDCGGRVSHISAAPIPGLFAAGSARGASPGALVASWRNDHTGDGFGLPRWLWRGDGQAARCA